MANPLLTCSILCYNYGRFLSQAIDSCLSQNVNSELFEILVIDDGSTDETQQVCLSYGSRIRVSRSSNLGFSTSLERALREANGEFVAYLDADDWWEPDKLAKVFPHLINGARVVFHPMWNVDVDGQRLGNAFGSIGNTSSVCVHRESGLTLLPATSEIFCRPLYDLGYGVQLPQPLGNYRIHPASMTDRSPSSSHTAFFAKTVHTTADRLFTLAETPPFWCSSSRMLMRLARTYRAEGSIKDFERATEIRKVAPAFISMLTALQAMISARYIPRRRELRLLMRFLLMLIPIYSKSRLQ